MIPSRLRALTAATLIALCSVAVTSAPADAAKKRTPNQRLQALERRITATSRTIAALQRDTERLYRENATLISNTLTLTQSFAGLIGCVQRTPVYSWPGFIYDNNGGTVSANITTTLTRWSNPGGVFETGVLSNPAGKINELGIANTQDCLNRATFYSPLTGGAALRGAKSATQEPKP